MSANRVFSWLATAVLSIGTALAGPEALAPEDVPEPLRPWVSWVKPSDVKDCPGAVFRQGKGDCVWPRSLRLELGPRGGRFELDVELFAESAVVLPGDRDAWPADVQVGESAIAVVPLEGRPVARLAAGHRRISGRFVWDELPLNLVLPASVANLTVSLEGRAYPAQPDAGGRLWLRSAPSADALSDSHTVRVFRTFEDQVPMASTVRFELSVSGQQREIEVPLAVLDGFVPFSLDSPLPAQVQPDGSLKLQVRAGTWTVEVGSRRMDLVDRLALPADAAGDEVWSFAPDNALRVVTLRGQNPVDPASVGAPPDWSERPTFVLQPGATLYVDQVQRGDSGSTADRLAMQRAIWLDFTGEGFSVKDTITGTIARGWRLDLPGRFALGRVSVNGVDQPVTRSDGGRGIEIRDSRLRLEADSRIESSDGEIPVSGWSTSISGWNATLNLPPGWRLLAVSGVDADRGSWASSFTLWDVFALLLIAAVTFRVCGLLPSLLLLGGLVLSWQVMAAPKALWLALVGFRALGKVVQPGGRLDRLAGRGVLLSGLALAIALLAYSVGQVRQAMYPSLGMSYSESAGPIVGGSALPQSPPPAPAEMAASMERDAVMRRESRVAAPPLLSEMKQKGKLAAQRYDLLDPSVRIQTGPGIPTWRWATVSLSVQGPVGAEEKLHLSLLSPAGSAVWSIASVVLLAAAFFLCLGVKGGALPAGIRRSVGAASPLLLVAMLASTGLPGEVHAQSAAFPPQELLGELRERLHPAPEPPECLPACADLAALSIVAKGDLVALRLELHAAADVPVPLPFAGASIRPVAVTADDGPATLRRDANGQLWMNARAGVAAVEMRFEAQGLNDLPVHLPLLPRRVDADLQRWSLAGLDAGGRATRVLTLSRVRDAGSELPAQEFGGAGELPPFALVERHLVLAQNWTVRTTISRSGQSTRPMTVRVGLLPGEQVTDQVVRIDGSQAVAEVGPGATLAYSSTVPATESLVLSASTQPRQVERWSVSANALWHVESAGMAPVAWTDGQVWQPRWSLWPGEEVGLRVTRPVAIDGNTVTIDKVTLHANAGQRSSELAADLKLRSSTGGNHAFELPQGAELLAVAIDGVVQPLRAEGGKLSVPLVPGAHDVRLEWRDAVEMGRSYGLPRLGLGTSAVNASVSVAVPRDRVVLFVDGPLVGPAVLLWGALLVIVAVAVLLSKVLPTPLGMIGWILLAVGLASASIISTVVVLGWFVLMALRARFSARTPWQFNLQQVVLVLATIVAAGAMMATLQQGLLGYPDLLISGNGSGSFNLRWYVDRTDGVTPYAEFVSVPVFAYRVLMLLWALWLAISVTRWAKWGWDCFSGGGYWKDLRVGERLKQLRSGRSGESAGPSAKQADTGSP